MINLPTVELVCVDCVNTLPAIRALRQSREQCLFLYCRIFTSEDVLTYGGIETVEIEPIKSMEEYSVFILEKLADYLAADHVLIIQHDGYVLNGENWNPEFLDYDYIGAPARWYDKHVVGNGGFSLRSRRLMQYLAAHPQRYPGMIEDRSICIERRDELEYFGFKFAPEKLAITFSVDADTTNAIPLTDYSKLFGFHGKKTLEIINSIPGLMEKQGQIIPKGKPVFLEMPKQITLVDISKKVSLLFELIGDYLKTQLTIAEIQFIKKHFVISMAREIKKPRGNRPDAVDTLAYGLRCIEILEIMQGVSAKGIPLYETKPKEKP
jgi:hypothetical protein